MICEPFVLIQDLDHARDQIAALVAQSTTFDRGLFQCRCLDVDVI